MATARPILRALGAALLLLGAAGCAREARPNVLLVTVSSLRSDQLGAYGDQAVDTPAMDAFLGESLVFEQAFTVSPITTASLGALLTARMPRNHGALNDGYDLSGADPTLATALREAGYRTGAFLPGALAGQPNLRRGFDVCDPSPPEASGADLVGRALAFIDEVQGDGDAWFVWVHVPDPGAPYAPGPELEARYLPPGAAAEPRQREETYAERDHLSPEAVEVARALYRGEVERADRCLAPLLARARAPEADTVAVLAGAHGEHFHESVGYTGHDAWLFENVLRVPLAFHRSTGGLSGSRRDLVTQLDVAPTLLALLGVPWQSRDGGLNLLATAAAADRLVVHETFAPQAFRDKLAVRQGPWKIQEARGQNWMQTETQSDFRRVTNLDDDPLETATTGARPEAGKAFATLRTLLGQWEGTQSDPAASRRPELDEGLKARVGALWEVQTPPSARAVFEPLPPDAGSDG